eukprot:4866110-Prymnesium_polylepis.1
MKRDAASRRPSIYRGANHHFTRASGRRPAVAPPSPCSSAVPPPRATAPGRTAAPPPLPPSAASLVRLPRVPPATRRARK